MNSFKQLLFVLSFLAFIPTTLAACQPALLNPPRLATLEAEQAINQATPTAVYYTAPTPTGEALLTQPEAIATIVPNPSLTLWVNETSAAHQTALQTMTAEFEQLHNIHVELVFVAPERLPGLVETSLISDTLPDLILHPAEYSLGWVDQGILSEEAATAALNALGRETFDPQALTLLQMPENSEQITALPSDGWQYLLVYRQDWFSALELPPPVQFSDIISGAQAIYRSEEIGAQTGVSTTLISGLVVPTESDLISTHQIFEHLAAANGCQLIDEKGEVLFLHPDCLDSLDFYRTLINGYSPSDIQTDISALNAYISGRTGFIWANPSILPILAGVHDTFTPKCPQCVANPAYLAENSRFITHITGRSPRAQSANFGQLTALGITGRGNQELAQIFTTYWFSTGYTKWLAVEPERKVPMRWSDSAGGQNFLELWQAMPIGNSGRTLTDLFGAEQVTELTQDIANSPRWGIRQGQGRLITQIYQKLTFSIVLQEMLSGYFTSSQAVIEAHKRVVDLIPNYAYHSSP